MRLLLIGFSAMTLLFTGTAQAGDCGRPVNRGAALPQASDALYILHSAVGELDCRLEDCDVTSDCAITAADALGALAASVGRMGNPHCNSECPTTEACEDTEAPICNGVCPEGQACVSAPTGDKRVTICHLPPGNPDNAHTIVVGAPAVNAHLAHGDHLGPCEDDGEGDGEGDGTMKIGSPACGHGKHTCDDGDVDDDEDSDEGEDLACRCVDVVVTTTTLGGTTTTLGGTTTTMAPTTTMGEATTTTMAPTTTMGEATTTTMAPTTTMGEATTTTMAETTTTMGEATTTTMAETTTTLGESTTTTMEVPVLQFGGRAF